MPSSAPLSLWARGIPSGGRRGSSARLDGHAADRRTTLQDTIVILRRAEDIARWSYSHATDAFNFGKTKRCKAQKNAEKSEPLNSTVKATRHPPWAFGSLVVGVHGFEVTTLGFGYHRRCSGWTACELGGRLGPGRDSMPRRLAVALNWSAGGMFRTRRRRPMAGDIAVVCYPTIGGNVGFGRLELGGKGF